MPDYSLRLPSWTVGENALDMLRTVCPAGKAAVIGGRKGTAAIRERLEKAAEGHVAFTGFLWYGGEASEENIRRLSGEDAVKQADMIFAVGGGKALDTCKALGYRVGKSVYAFPTIASTCAACSVVAILYHPDGSFAAPCFLPGPPAHTFIDTAVISAAPPRYLWAGLGDTYAKYFESSVSSRGDELAYYHALGVGVSRSCLDPLLRYGEKAYRDHLEKKVTEEVTQVILTVIVTTAIASILLTADRIIDYNTGLAHAINYGLTSYPEVEHNHLHGEIVSFGVLVLLLIEAQIDPAYSQVFDRMLAFNRAVKLPLRLEDLGLTQEDTDTVIDKALAMPDIDHNPYPITREMLVQAFAQLRAAVNE